MNDLILVAFGVVLGCVSSLGSFAVVYRQRRQMYATQRAHLDAEEQVFLSAIKQRSMELAQTQAGRKLLAFYTTRVEQTQTRNDPKQMHAQNDASLPSTRV